MFRLAVALIVAFAGYPATAADWRPMGTAIDGSVFRADRESFRYVGSSPQVWVEEDASKSAQKSYERALSLWRFDCSNATYLTVSWITYDEKGSEIERYNAQRLTGGHEAVAPGTIADAVMKMVCAN